VKGMHVIPAAALCAYIQIHCYFPMQSQTKSLSSGPHGMQTQWRETRAQACYAASSCKAGCGNGTCRMCLLQLNTSTFGMWWMRAAVEVLQNTIRAVVACCCAALGVLVGTSLV